MLSSLPYDLLLSCLARVSRLYYPTLSLVSKSFRSLLASPELYKARSLLGHTEGCLYVCIYNSNSDQNPRWFTLCRKPDENLSNNTTCPTSKKKKLSGYVLNQVPITHSPPVNYWSDDIVAVGSSIYHIGGSRYSSSLSVLDCTTHTWREAPSFRVKLRSLTACVIDKKVYVAGWYQDNVAFKTSIIEVFDTKTQIWDPIPWNKGLDPDPRNRGELYYRSTCIDGKFHLRTGTRKLFAYNSKEDRWDMLGIRMLRHMHANLYCVIENVLYSASYDGGFRWYDTEVSEWKNLEGLVGLPNLSHAGRVKLADYGGKMAVLWHESWPDDGYFYERRIWCAEIALERRNKNCEIWGKVVWFDHVLTVPGKYGDMKVLAVTV